MRRATAGRLVWSGIVVGAMLVIAGTVVVQNPPEWTGSSETLSRGETVSTQARLVRDVAPGSIGAEHLRPGAVVAAAIAEGAIDSSKIRFNHHVVPTGPGLDLGAAEEPWRDLFLEGGIQAGESLTIETAHGFLAITPEGDLVVSGNIHAGHSRGTPTVLAAQEAPISSVRVVHCWDTNEDGRPTPGEDANGDGAFDVLDCRGETGAEGPRGPEGGPPGPVGPVGSPGEPGHEVLMQSRDATANECPGGGIAFVYGLDDGAGLVGEHDGALDPQEVDGEVPVCDGIAGRDGWHSIADTFAVGPGTSCPFGGFRMDFGGDQDGDGTLDPGEVEQTRTLCHGHSAVSLVRVEGRAPDATCPAGGYDLLSGLDDGLGAGTADDGLLHNDEARAVNYVCHGQTGPQGATGPQGVQGVQGPQGDVGDTGPQGEHGHDALVRVTEEAPGACPAGGLLVESGTDDGAPSGTAGNGVLEPGEIDDSRRVCDGSGATGAAGRDALARTGAAPPSATCPSGGVLLEYGTDDGTPTGTAANGILEAGEVDGQETLCHGSDGATGAQGPAGATGPQGPAGPAGADGTDGTDGTAGHDALVKLTPEAPNAQCTEGGVLVEMGTDDGAPSGTPDNGVLEAGEVDDSERVCNGSGSIGANGFNGLVETAPAPVAQCPAGGTQVDAGLDDGSGGGTANNGVLEPGEVAQTAYVCDGADGAAGADGATGPAGPQGPAGPAGADGNDGPQGPQGPAGSDGADGDDGADSLLRETPEGAGANCTNAGSLVEAGLDNGDGGGTPGDGVLQAGEVDRSFYLCNGADGAQGPQGPDGPQGAAGPQGPAGAAGTDGKTTLFVETDEAPGANCPQGGSQWSWGLDNGDGAGTAGDDILHQDEVDATDYICHGASTLWSTFPESPGSNCAQGGLSIHRGLDNGDGGGTAVNGVLESGEIDFTDYVCDGQSTLWSTFQESHGSNCAQGGLSIHRGLDNGDGGATAANGVLESGEIDFTDYVCDGQSTLWSTFQESPGSNCAQGGLSIHRGLDNGDGGATAANGVLESGEIDFTDYVCDGQSTLWSTFPETPGSNCAQGGLSIHRGLDNGDGGGTAANGVLESGEIDFTDYVCDGGSSLVRMEDEPSGTNCAVGGTKVLTGMDNGDGAGTGGDGVLHDDEVDDTSYVCETPRHRREAPRDNTITTVDSASTQGRLSSITIGTDGLPVISHYDATNRDLAMTHCNDIACTSSTNTPLDTTGNVGGYTSIAIGTDGLPVISYYDLTNGDLKVAHCSNTACTSSTNTAIDTAGNVGSSTSITIGTDALPIISYYDSTNDDLKVAHCSNTVCTSSTNTALDTTGMVGLHSSITIGIDGFAVISYYDSTNGNLKVAHCSNTACTSSTNTAIDTTGDVGSSTSITIGTDGLPIISYYDLTNDDLKVAHCSNMVCTSSTNTALDTTGMVGAPTSITIGTDGLPVISYQDISNRDLKVAHCSNTACSSSTNTALDTIGDVGMYTGITIGVDGLPIISYHDFTNGDLKVAHLANEFGIPYWSRR